VDRNGIVWFTESNATKLARFDPSTDTFKEYIVPGAGDMWGMAIDPQGNIWLTQYSLKGSINPGGAVEPGGSGRLIRFNPNNRNFTVINIPTPGAFPFRVTSDAEGRIWFTELLGDRIGCYDPSSGKIQEYAVPTEFAGPADLTFDNHGILWFTEAYNESVARFDSASNTFVEYHFSSMDPTQFVGSPVGISVTHDGIVWVADHGGNWIVELNATSHQVTLYPTHFPPPQVYPISLVNDLLVDGQGRIWFTEHGGNSIGYLDPGLQKMVEYPIPTGPISTALWLALAPNGDLWFTEWSSNKIGVVNANLPIPLALSVSENHLSLPTDGQATLFLELSSQGFVGAGTYDYAWPSYNPGDVNVTFSPQGASVSGETNVQSQARITVSSRTLPGEYVLGLGFDAGVVRVWSMVQTEVTAQRSITGYITNNPWLPVGAIVIIMLVVLTATRRVRARGRRNSAIPRRQHGGQ
jgi:virginiamycin B lyase